MSKEDHEIPKQVLEKREQNSYRNLPGLLATCTANMGVKPSFDQSGSPLYDAELDSDTENEPFWMQNDNPVERFKLFDDDLDKEKGQDEVSKDKVKNEGHRKKEKPTITKTSSVNNKLDFDGNSTIKKQKTSHADVRTNSQARSKSPVNVTSAKPTGSK